MGDGCSVFERSDFVKVRTGWGTGSRNSSFQFFLQLPDTIVIPVASRCEEFTFQNHSCGVSRLLQNPVCFAGFFIPELQEGLILTPCGIGNCKRDQSTRNKEKSGGRSHFICRRGFTVPCCYGESIYRPPGTLARG